jgi:hypothetical protein
LGGVNTDVLIPSNTKPTKKRMIDEKLEREYPEVRSNFYLDFYDKSVLFSE